MTPQQATAVLGKNKENPGMKEMEMAWQEFFKDKPRLKNDEKERKEQEEFHHWYNHVRKQSDTGKTPAEMYKEIYGKEPLKNPTEMSRMMNFELEDYGGNYEDEDLDEAHKQAVEIANEMFEKDIWKNAKADLKEVTKKEACQSMFKLGFLSYMKIMDEQMMDFKDKAEKNPKEFEKTLIKFKDLMDEEKDG